jgi:ketosteroid isomerase-like protein
VTSSRDVLVLVLALVGALSTGCASGGAHSATESPEAAAIRSARVAQNGAIAAGDTASAATYWTEDVEIRRGLGQLVVGRSAYQRILLPDSAAVHRGTALIYERTTSSVDVSTQWPLAYESGEWAAHLGSATGAVVIRGRYAAQWVKRGSRWLIRGEVYVALTCAGAGCEYSAAP